MKKCLGCKKSFKPRDKRQLFCGSRVHEKGCAFRLKKENQRVWVKKRRDTLVAIEKKYKELVSGHGWDKDHFIYQCSDGAHNSFWATVIQSDEWKAWEKVGNEYGYDIDECRECGWISAEHWKTFVKFINNLK